jgi:hypothetical protein
MISTAFKDKTEEVATLQKVANLFREQITREITAEVEHLLHACPRISYLDTAAAELAQRFNLTEQQIRWHRAFLLRGLMKALKIRQLEISPRSSIAQIQISFDAGILRDHLNATVSPQIVRKAKLTKLAWLPDMLTLTTSPTAVVHLKWNQNELDVSVQLSGSNTVTKDWLAAFISENDQAIAAAVGRCFSVETMLQSRRINNETN